MKNFKTEAASPLHLSLSPLRLVLTCVAGITLLVWPAIAAELRPHQHRAGNLLCTLIALPGNAFTTVAAPPEVNDGRFRSDAVGINVNYTGFTPQAQAAFQHAINIWQTQVTSSVPVTVNANFTSLGPGVLGSAGFTSVWPNFANAPVANTYFPAPIAYALAGSALSSSPQINASFSSTFPFYFGTDGLPPAGQYDFVSVVLHELGHGLGFVGSMEVSGSTGSWGGIGAGFPFIYDRFVVNASNQPLISAFSNNSAALRTQLISNNVFWNGPFGAAANGNVNPRLYAPTTWSDGSSIAHLDDATYPAGTANSLMTHALNAAEAIHNPGPITRGIFRDSGWALDTGTPTCSYTLSAASFTIGQPGGPGTVGVTTTPGCTWTAVSNSGFITVTGGASGNGSGIVSYSVPANTGAQRSGTITIAGQTFTLTQTPCGYTLSATSFTIGQPGGPGTVGVTTTPGCSWTAVSNNTEFITITGGAVSSGDGLVTYQVLANTGAQRIGTITIAGQTFTLTQSAAPTCTYTLSATAFAIGNPSTNGSVGVTTSAGCAWTAVSNDAFITVTGGASSTGSGLVTYTAAANTGAVRTGTITIAGQTFTLSQGPLMTVNHASLAFGAVNSGGTLNNITSAQAVTVTFAGVSPTWIATTSTPWLQVSGGSGTGAGQFTVSVRSVAGLPSTGSVSGSVSIVSGGVANSPLTVPVTLTLFATSASAPFGSFDTPASGSSVAGSIAVTGWALDDIEVVRVAIWRDKVPGETTVPNPGPGLGTGKIYIADALFIEGARPDVEAAYPGAPYAYRSGWGYLMLTWGLWNQGNSPFTFYAFAYDRDGHGVSLGSKTLTVSNGTATRPFGSIDVPAYGGTMSGVSYNFGWALTPNATPTCTITNGNVFVSVDSAPLTPVSYGDTRPDIQAGFPGFSNGSNAGGAYLMDTTTMSNGTHQIGWYVVDSCARAEGIGSRFFNVLNASSSQPTFAKATVGRPTFAKATVGGQSVIADASLLDAPVEVRRGTESTLVYPGLAGDRVVAIGQSDRVEVQLPHMNGARYSGYQVVNGEHRQLPLGSSLDAAQGIFYWQPAAGFLGSYDLEFKTSPDGAPVRVRAVIGTSVQAVIDTPQPGATEAVFTIAGWAIDLAATDGTGVDAVHVWAYPATGEAPIFLGVAAYGEGRPDIGALFGAQFTGASFSLPVQGLAPGTYDVVVYPHSAVAGEFRGAQVVKVRIP